MPNPEVLIIGGGLAGLCCARTLHQAGRSCLILEASDGIGGRARTDTIDGFQCDRGFQVLLTAYPEAQEILNYPNLGLQTFEPGALVRYRGKFVRFSDPWRRPRHAIATALSPLASLSDKLRVAKLKYDVSRGPLNKLFERSETTTLSRLRTARFSDRIIEHFFKPFLGGVFLENELTTSSRMFDFVFRMFANGDAALPRDGMGAMAKQIAQQLPAHFIRINAPVAQLKPKQVVLESGEVLSAPTVVVACDLSAALKLQGMPSGGIKSQAGKSVTCLYFTAPKPPLAEPILVLNGEGSGPINNLCVPSQVCPSYAPRGHSLISVSSLGTSSQSCLDSLEASVRAQLKTWYGSQVESWNHLKTYCIPNALPDQTAPSLNPVAKNPCLSDGLYVCGDHRNTASIQGAMVSGRETAEGVLKLMPPRS